MQPTQPGDDRLREIINRANQEQRNGQVPIIQVKPRPSGWACPKCGVVADQRVEPAPGTILGYRWMTVGDEPRLHMPDDERPAPVNVLAEEVTSRDIEDGHPTGFYITMHCLNCFNIWQKRKMMEEIRANVPILEWKGTRDAATDSQG